MPFYLHTLESPLPVYDGKVIPEGSLRKMITHSSSQKLSTEEVYTMNPVREEDAMIQEFVPLNEHEAFVRLRRRHMDQIVVGYRMNSRRKVELISEPEIHHLGRSFGATNFFPIIDETLPKLMVKEVLLYSPEDREQVKMQRKVSVKQ